MYKNIVKIVLIVFLSGSTAAQNADINMLRKMNQNDSPFFDKSFKFITNSDVPVSFGAPVLIFSYGMIKNDDKATRSSLEIGSALVLSTLLTTGLKYSINRPRPFTTYSDIEKKSGGGSPSFPSGHTSTAFAFATSMSLTYPKWYVIAPSYLYAGLVAYSRMYLGVHYPSDVLGGIIVGVGSSLLVWQVSKRMQ